MVPPAFRQNILPLIFLLNAISIFFAFDSAHGLAKTLKRTEDFVQFTGERVPSLVGSEVKELSLYRYTKAGYKAIPFQIDKRDSSGRYVFPDETVRDPNRDGTSLDDNDELVFMAKDAGGRCDGSAWVEGAKDGVEIEVIDPLTGGRCWVYLFHRPGSDPPETEDYVRYWVEDNKEHVYTPQYEFEQPLGVTYYDHLRFRKPDGTWGEDVLDRTKIGLKATLLNGSIPVWIPEQEVKARIFGVIDGPVRVIRDEVDYVHVKIIGLDWMTETLLTYYYNGNISPLEVNIPVNLHKLFLDIKFYWALDYNEAIIGSTFRNPANPDGIILDGKKDENVDIKTDNKYILVTGPQGAILDVLVFEEALSLQMDRTTYLNEDLSKHEPDEDHPGQISAGFWMKISTSLKKGDYKYWYYHYYPFPFHEKKIQEIINMIEKPLQLTFKPLEPQQGL